MGCSTGTHRYLWLHHVSAKETSKVDFSNTAATCIFHLNTMCSGIARRMLVSSAKGRSQWLGTVRPDWCAIDSRDFSMYNVMHAAFCIHGISFHPFLHWKRRRTG